MLFSLDEEAKKGWDKVNNEEMKELIKQSQGTKKE